MNNPAISRDLVSRPVHLPPKSKEEEEKHLKELQSILKNSANTGREERKRERKRKREREKEEEKEKE